MTNEDILSQLDSTMKGNAIDAGDRVVISEIVGRALKAFDAMDRIAGALERLADSQQRIVGLSDISNLTGIDLAARAP